eukprot:scaffold84431_cov72-Cyclotella_meneghiniana.AAC.2
MTFGTTPTASDGPSSSVAIANFSTYEDLSSRLVLLPFNDDECTGAKVCSHKVLIESSSAVRSTDEERNTQTADDTIDDKETQCASDGKNAEPESITPENAGSESDSSLPIEIEGSEFNSDTATENQNAGNDNTKIDDCPNNSKRDSAVRDTQVEGERNDGSNNKDSSGAANNMLIMITDGRDDSTSSQAEDSSKNEESRANLPSSTTGTNEQAIPVGYVLVKLTGKIASTEHSVEQLEDREFTEILSLLRDVAYPITLAFALPESLNKDNANNDDTTCNIPSEEASEETTLDSDSERDEKNAQSQDDDELNNHAVMASREEAAKYAAQAASELRGRLSRWGFKAATKAAEAAQAVQELREERQRKMAEERDNQEPCEEKKCDGPAPTPSSNSSSDSTTSDCCHLFLQTALGFIQLDKPIETLSSSYLFSPQKKSATVTNMSVVAVRLSEEKACPVGKNAYKFQWYRSKNECNNSESLPTDWCKLHGACYAAYQPSVSDIGYKLSCVVEFGEGPKSQRLILPISVSTDLDLLESAKATLFKDSSENWVTFSSLKSSGSVFRFRILVSNTGPESDSISSSSFFVDQLVGTAFEPLYEESLRVIDVKAISDPSRPRSFEIVFPKANVCTALESLNYILKLDAPDRLTREKFLVALGCAGFPGQLSSLSPNTTLLPYSNDIELTISDDGEKQKEIGEADTDTSSLDKHPSVSKNLYAIQLEAQMKDMQSELDAKTALISKLQQKINATNEDKKQTEIELIQTRCKAENLAQCEREVKERDMLISDQERTIKSLNNEKAVLTASVEMRDGKIDAQLEQIKDLKKDLDNAIRQVEEARKNEAEQVRAKLEAEKAKASMDAEALIAEMKKEEVRFQDELKAAQLIIEELNGKYASTKELATKSREESERLLSESKRLKMERNTFKHKADGLAREMSKIQSAKPEKQPVNKHETMITTLTQTIEQLRSHNNQLQKEMALLTSEKRGLQAELQATRSAHEQSTRYLTSKETITPNRDALRADELEIIVSNLYQTIDAQDQQISTLKQINLALMKEINETKAK